MKNRKGKQLAACFMTFSLLLGSFSGGGIVVKGEQPTPVIEVKEENNNFDNGIFDFSRDSGCIADSEIVDDFQGKSHVLHITRNLGTLNDEGKYGTSNSKISFVKTYEEAKEGKIYSFSLYDDIAYHNQTVIQIVNQNAQTGELMNVYYGLKCNYDSSKKTYTEGYWYRAQWKGAENGDVSGFIEKPRTSGWHEFKIDMSKAGALNFVFDGEEVASVNTKLPGCFAFSKICIADYWWDANNGAEFLNKDVYLDDLVISTKQEESVDCPTEPKTYDLLNKFGWKGIEGLEDYTNYEYSLDGGASYMDCTCNPQDIPEGEYPVGMVCVRRKQTAMDQPFFPELANDTAFTSNSDDLYLDFEDEEDLERIIVYEGGKAAVDEESHSGNQAVKLLGKSDYNRNIYLDMKNQKYTGKIINIWFYDDMNHNRKIMFGPGNDRTNSSRPWETKDEKWHFFISDTNKYYTRVNKEAQVATSIPCSKGWHCFTWDFTDLANCRMSIDGVLVRTVAVTEPVASNFAFVDWWNNSGMTEDAPLIFDDLSITSEPFILAMVDAPTQPVEDDVQNTFGFDFVPGYSEASQYEFSCDGGKKWSTCTANPVSIPDGDYKAGEVQVRIRALDGMLPGLILKSENAYTSSLADEFKALENAITQAEAFYSGDYKQDETFEAFKSCLEHVKKITVDSSIDEITDAKKQLEEAVNGLIQMVPEYTVYEFEQGEAALNPFTAQKGTLTKGEGLSVFGKDPREYYNNKHGAELVPVSEDGKYVSEASYTFAKSISDYIVKIGYNTIASTNNIQEIVLYDEEGRYLGFRSLAGNQTNFQAFYNNGSGEQVVDTGIRRLNNDRILEWDFVNSKGKAVLTMDDLVLATADMTSFNRIVVRAYDGTNPTETVKFDRVTFMKKNPVTEISTAKDSVVLGYYDTFDMGKIYLDLKKENMSYDTTDHFTYQSVNKEVAEVTSEGSVEPMAPGKTTVTVTADSGASKTVAIEVKDFKINSIYFTDSPVIDIKAIGAPGQDKNNSVPVTKLSELTLDVNDSKVVNAVIDPANATARLLEWSSDNEDVVHVKDGLVTGINYGTASVTATAKDGSGVSASIKITVAPVDYSEFTKLYVSLEGNDYTGDGSEEAPYATIERARDEIRSLCGNFVSTGFVVYFEEGNYPVSDTIVFDSQDSGTAQTPVVYSAKEGSDVKFVGGISFDTSEFRKVDQSSPLYSRIPESVRSNVYCVDLSKWGITPRDLQVVGHSAGGLQNFKEVFSEFNFDKPYFSVCLNGEPMTLSRFPNTDFIKVTKVVNAGEYSRHWLPDMILNGKGYEYQPGMEEDTFSFTSSDIPQSKLDSWKQSINEENRGAWMIGYWGAAYSDQSVPIASIEGNTITSGLISHYLPQNKANFYVYNLIEELDAENEWYIDESTDPEHPVLYFYPPAGIDMADKKNSITIPTLDTEMFCFDNSDYIKVTDIDMEGANNGIAIINGGSNNVIKNADIKNTMGMVGKINNSNETATFNGFSNCNFTHIDGGISLNGGDADTLERGYNFVENCTFTDISRNNKTYNPAVNLGGVGNRLTNTVISDSPHNVIMFSGPESTIEFCELYDCVKTAGDQAGIYTGRDTIDRGTVIRNSYFHNIYHSDSVENSAIYLDDAKAGVDILDCVFDNTAQGITLGGGRDVNIIGCKFINLSVGITTSPSGYIGMSGQYQHGLGTICNSSNYDAMTTVPWDDRESAYGRFDHLAEVMEDNFKLGKYCKVIDCEFINMKKFKPDANETITDYNIWSKYWKVMPYDVQKEMIDDWIFTKNNQYSNNLGTDDLSYKTTYSIVLTAQGEGTVTGARKDITKGLEYKVVADPNPGYEFVAWEDQTGETISSNLVYIFTADADQNLTAVFKPVE